MPRVHGRCLAFEMVGYGDSIPAGRDREISVARQADYLHLAVGRESGRIHARPYLEHGGAAALVRQIRSLDVHDTLAVEHDLPKLGVPARVVWGRQTGSRRSATASAWPRISAPT